MEEKMERVFLFVVLPFHWLGLTSLDFWETLSYTYFIPFMKLEVFFFFFFLKGACLAYKSHHIYQTSTAHFRHQSACPQGPD